MEIELKPSDTDLLKKARLGEQHAFRGLVDRYRHQVRSTVFSMLGDTAEVDDVAQDVFIRFYKSMANFREDAKLSTYLTRIAINLSLNELKRRQRKSRIIPLFRNKGGEESVAIQLPDRSMNPRRMEIAETIRKALNTLSPEFKAVVTLRLVEGYSVQETAEILELPNGTVASRLMRAQKKLRQVIDQWEKH